MSINKKVTSFAMTQGTAEELDKLRDHYNENYTLVISRAIAQLYHTTFTTNNQKGE
jgi:hypothetical protein